MTPAKDLLVKAGLDKTYWGLHIIAWEETGEKPEGTEAEANEWTTCACGKQDPRIPREDFAPKDSRLRQLGGEFGYVFEDETTEFYDIPQTPLCAATILIAIEARAREILAELPTP